MNSVKITIYESTKQAHVSVNGISTSIIKYVRSATFSETSGILFLYNSQKIEIAQVNVMDDKNITFVPMKNSKFIFENISEEMNIWS